MADTTDDPLPSFVAEQWRRGDLALAMERRDYWLNFAFVEGEQWVQWDRANRVVEQWAGTKDVRRVWLVSNRMQPNLVTLISKLTKRELAFEVPATAADDGTIAGARLAEHLLEAARTDQLWEQVRSDALYNVFLGGTAAVAVEWDANAGERLGVDDASGKVVHEGEVQLSSLSIAEFTLEPGTRSWQDARWWIMAKAMPPAQIQELYKLDSPPAADTSITTGPLQRRLWAERGFATNIDLATVFTLYERPHRDREKGRWAVVCGGETIADKPWPFPFRRLNLFPFRQLRLPRRWTGGTMLNDARPLQAAYNHAGSMLSEHMKLAGSARLAIPDQANVDAEQLTDTPGEALYYDGLGGQAPHWIDPPNIPRWLVELKMQYRADLDDVMAVHAISRGEAPGDRNSGLALSVLAEKDDTPLGQMAHDQSEGWGYIASRVLEIWASKVVETRTATVQTESKVPIVRTWNGKRLRDQTTATVPLDATLPHSRVAMQAWIVNLVDRFPQQFAGLNLTTVARMLDLPGTELFGEAVDADVAQAERENALMSIGMIPAMDNEPFPAPFDNHAVHIAEHNRFRKSAAYMYAEREVRQIVDLHVQAHEKAEMQQMVHQREMNQVLPGAAAMPQANEPPGSAVPPDSAERQAAGTPPGHPLMLPPGPGPSQPAAA